MKLRAWQQACVENALRLYRSQKHFMCLATPGAGKTVMAAELAARLIKLNKVDFVLCFSPSSEVNESIQRTFTHRLHKRFDGLIGAIGSVYTYQFMPSLTPEFWMLLKTHKVLVIMDEVHHLKGTDPSNANAWGEEVLLNIQENAAYTLALSGTPWRSDKAPIVLSKFTEPDNTIHCDFIYGLQQAVKDNICRNPNIVLIDNDKIQIKNDEITDAFSSVSALLEHSPLSYHALITHPEIIRYILKQGISKLSEIRLSNSQAGGLVVAASITHAKFILHMLTTELNQSACIVTSKLKQPTQIIASFRHSQIQWIVSVGMISEGTDIPRLQVCCHLSLIKTEMHYRQVLGRILRVNSNKKQQAWLFTLAEKTLSAFAYRIQQDLPDAAVVIEQNASQELSINLETQEATPSLHPEHNQPSIDLHLLNESTQFPQQKLTDIEEENHYNLSLIGGFKEQIVKMFDVHLANN
ncbi:DEAD/DEAH box helicase family protein [uncultured Shewanella sp.]|uniref:DEAD/DEAH box helicase n=1 Tax=uncultured Shewanella sp. TaxID=173975 RepID=UPI00262DB4A4|nr:DEAD/DEAH box helicase family protein [uncultured Shewanella sp.]